MASSIKKFTAVRRPIYCAKISANGKEFATAFAVVKEFKKRFVEYENCDYDSEYSEGCWHIRLYRECVIDFI